jgi:hypothetical protein
MKKLYKFLLTGLLSLPACSDHLNIEKSDSPQGYADSQVVGTWKITGYTSNKAYDWDGNGSKETDIYSTWSPCEKDNLYQFTPDKTGTFKINCSTSSSGTWLIISTKYLVYKPDNQVSETAKLVSMTSVEFKTAEDVTVSTGQNLTLTKTWSRQ